MEEQIEFIAKSLEDTAKELELTSTITNHKKVQLTFILKMNATLLRKVINGNL